MIIREICSRHVVSGPCEHLFALLRRSVFQSPCYHASSFRSRACHRSHVCVFAWPWLNVGELPRFYNQLQHLVVVQFAGSALEKGLGDVLWARPMHFELCGIREVLSNGSNNKSQSGLSISNRLVRPLKNEELGYDENNRNDEANNSTPAWSRFHSW
jgi:hypothetical protein